MKLAISVTSAPSGFDIQESSHYASVQCPHYRNMKQASATLEFSATANQSSATNRAMTGEISLSLPTASLSAFIIDQSMCVLMLLPMESVARAGLDSSRLIATLDGFLDAAECSGPQQSARLNRCS